MSSLSRRACYKCGNVGHYAEVCTSSERLCYNCKQPGHESNQCPLPRTTESKTLHAPISSTSSNIFPAKQCYHCQGLGHVQADCPTLRISGGAAGGRCYSCGQMGHIARNCPNPAGAGAGPAIRGGRPAGFPRGGGYAGGYGVTTNRAATCYKCGGPNHYARDCQAQAMKCYACGKLVSSGHAADVYIANMLRDISLVTALHQTEDPSTPLARPATSVTSLATSARTALPKSTVRQTPSQMVTQTDTVTATPVADATTEIPATVAPTATVA
jgi:cellular nucleic acid-binding protein